MPRPDTCVTFGRRRESRLEDALDELRVRRLRVGRKPALRDRLGADVVEIQPGAVVGQFYRDFVADLPHGQRDLAGLGLARVRAHAARLDAVVERIAKQMFERSDEFFQHRPVELGLPAADLEVGALVEFLRRSAHYPVQALRKAPERHRADREELLLDIARQPRLRHQRRIGIIEVLQQRLLHRGDVVDAFRQRTGQLLEARITVELQWVETFGRFPYLRHPRLNLRLALDFDFAHLRAQPDHATGEFEEIGFQRPELAFDARAGNRHLAGFVHEPVDHVGTHPQVRALARFGLDVRRGCR